MHPTMLQDKDYLCLANPIWTNAHRTSNLSLHGVPSLANFPVWLDDMIFEWARKYSILVGHIQNSVDGRIKSTQLKTFRCLTVAVGSCIGTPMF